MEKLYEYLNLNVDGINISPDIHNDQKNEQLEEPSKKPELSTKEEILSKEKLFPKKFLLKDNIKKFCKPAYYLKARKLLASYLEKNKDEYFNSNKTLLTIMAPSEKLFSVDHKMSFIQSPSEDHSYFYPLRKQIERIEETIQYIKNDELKNSLNDLLKRHQEYIVELVKKCLEKKDNNEQINEEIFESNGIIVCDDLKEYEISLKDAYKISSYDPKEFTYRGSNKSGASIGSIVDEIYFKVDTDNHLLVPSKENSVYSFYYSLYNTEDYISPTSIVFLKNIPILPPHACDSSIRKQLSDFRIDMAKQTKHPEYMIPVKDAFDLNPQLQQKVLTSLNETMVTIQASHLIRGKSLETFLEEAVENPSLFDQLDKESFSAHVISSLCLMFIDYKPDNLIVEEGTNKIVGIDNDGAIDSDELRKDRGRDEYYADVKNVLYTLPLMNDPIHPSVRKIIIDLDPYYFIIKWLFLSFLGDISLLTTASIPCNVVTDSDEVYRKKYNNLMKTLSLPTYLPKQFLGKLIERIKIIKKEISADEHLTHMELFEKVNCFLSIYYKAIKNMVPKEISERSPKISSDYIYQVHLLYNGDFEYIKLIQNHSNIESKKLEEIIKKLRNTNFHNGVRGNCGILQGNDIGMEGEPIEKVKFIECILDFLKITKFEDINSTENSIYSIVDILYEVSLDLKTINLCFLVSDFHPSWDLNKYKIVLKLIKSGSPIKVLKFFIELFKVNLNEPESLRESTYHAAIKSNFKNVLDVLILMAQHKADHEVKNNGLTPLEVVIKNKDFILFIGLLYTGHGRKLENYREFITYYSSLTDSQKKLAKESIDLIFHNNQKLSWKLSLSQLLPLVSSTNKLEEGDILIKTATESDRILRKKYVEQIFKKDSEEPLKTNQFGTRSVPYIYDEFGHRIYFKFFPQMPGMEIAVNRLTERMFTNCTPYNEMAIINDTPILLVQYVPGDTLCDLFIKIPKTINLNNPDQLFVILMASIYGDNMIDILTKPPELYQINSYNMSKVLVSAMLINGADGNLGNFIVSKTNEFTYRIICIDNDQAFMPPVTKQIKTGLLTSKPSLQVETVLFLLDQMNHYISELLVEDIVLMDMDDLMESWLTSLKINHQSAIDLYSSIKDKMKKCNTVVGIPFAPGMIGRIYSKLIRLKMICIQLKNEKKRITHFELLEVLEPYIASRYRQLLMDKSISILDKFKKLKKLDESATISNLTSSVNVSSMLLESRDIPNSVDIICQLNSGAFGPEQALKEFYQIKDQNIKFASVKNLGTKSEQLKDCVIEKMLAETDFSKLEIQQETNLLNSMKNGTEREIGVLTIINSSTFTLSYLKDNFKFSYISKLIIKNSKIFDGLKGTLSTVLEFPVLSHLIVEGCQKLLSIKIKAENLRLLNASNCPMLREFSVESTNLEIIQLKDTLSQTNQIILELISKCKKLTYLDVSFSKIKVLNNLDLYLQFPNLKTFKAKNLIGVEKFILYLPRCKVFDIDLSYAQIMIGEVSALKTPSTHELLKKLKKIQVNVIGFDPLLSIKLPMRGFFNVANSMENSNFVFNFENETINKLGFPIDQKSKMAIQSIYSYSIVIVFLDISDSTSFNRLNSKLSRFNMKSNQNKPWEHSHIFFILVSIGYAIDTSTYDKLSDFKQKFRFDKELTIDYFTDQAEVEKFALTLVEELKKYESDKVELEKEI